ncbi:hypothetical protein FNYG_11245 [Fusarium nygamai]|uniref:Uncharacterized protein n=1 Tax=Gibberella nygamai TaxID=42673 RepID=A0A2K0VZI5_GIBNY|nr:hypothetical protein FNYG_11245 [Fusarium nygamai]
MLFAVFEWSLSIIIELEIIFAQELEVVPIIAPKLIIVPEKKILSLGSNVLKKPCVDYLLQDKNNVLTIACRTLASAENIAARRSLAKAVALGVASLDIDHGTAKHDLVISLVSFAHHATIVRSATKSKTGIATTSYVSPAICGVDNQAKAVDITVLSDVGVDPGVDRLYTIKTVGEPRGPRKGWKARTIIRGSFRGNGNSALAKPLINLSWLDTGSKAWLKEGIKWSHIRQKLTGADSAAAANLLANADEPCNRRSPEERRRILAGLKWMGLFSDGVAAGGDSPFDSLSDQMNKLCSFHAGERDLVMLQHKFVLD